jgi:hypothetical protein
MKINVKVNEKGIFIIRAVRHKRGIRSTQPDKEHEQAPDKPKRTKARLVFAQEAIVQIVPFGIMGAKPPRDLLKRVREALKQNPEWTAQDWEPISRTHVKRAWKLLQKP